MVSGVVGPCTRSSATSFSSVPCTVASAVKSDASRTDTSSEMSGPLVGGPGGHPPSMVHGWPLRPRLSRAGEQLQWSVRAGPVADPCRMADDVPSGDGQHDDVGGQVRAHQGHRDTDGPAAVSGAAPGREEGRLSGARAVIQW